MVWCNCKLYIIRDISRSVTRIKISPVLAHTHTHTQRAKVERSQFGESNRSFSQNEELCRDLHNGERQRESWIQSRTGKYTLININQSSCYTHKSVEFLKSIQWFGRNLYFRHWMKKYKNVDPPGDTSY